MKLKAITKIILAGLITVAILALTLIKVLDVPVISTKAEASGTVVVNLSVSGKNARRGR